MIFHFISFLYYNFFFHFIHKKLIKFPIVFIFIIIIQEERARQKEERAIKWV